MPSSPRNERPVHKASPGETRKTHNIRKHEFRSRNSHLDPMTEKMAQNEFRGFFNLFGLMLFFFFLNHQAQHILKEGTLIGLARVKSMFIRFDLLPAWLGLASLSLLAYPLTKLYLNGRIPSLLLPFLHHGIQCLMFSFAVAVALSTNWPMVSTAFLLLEMLVILMKVHSYIVTNRELSEMECNKDEGRKKFMATITFKNYLFYMVVPTLVYEPEYPRTERIRIGYLIEKVSSFMGLWAVLHVLVEQYVTPVLEQTPTMSPIEAFNKLIIPIMLCYIILFYIVFDVICNALAEVTRFADREFYSDWWNSTTWDEFARKWNKPVHEWLLRHVYLESVKTYKMSKISASVTTFFFSSLLHEFFLAVVFRLVRPWLFCLQMMQLPLIFIGRHLKGTRLGNILFWSGLAIGPPMLSILYCREYYLHLHN